MSASWAASDTRRREPSIMLGPAESRMKSSAMDMRRSKFVTAEYIVGLTCSIAGTAMGLLALTTVSTTAGGERSGAVTTAVLLSLIALATGGFVPLVPRACRRFGVRRTYVAAMLMTAAVWGVLGVLVLRGFVTVGVLYLSGLVLGVVMAATTVIKPFYSRVFLGGAGMSVSYAKQSLVSGVAWVAGALIGGVLIAGFGAGWPIILNAALFLPLAFTIARTTAADEPEMSARDDRGHRSAFAHLRGNPGIREAMLVAALAVLLVGPMTSMVVPLVDSLPDFPAAGAGLLMAAIGLGRIATPTFVSRLGRRWTSIDAALIVNGLSGVVLIVLAAVSTVIAGGPEVAIWCLLGAGFGAGRFSGRAFSMGAAVDSGDDEQRVETMSSLIFVVLLATPFGLLLWGILLDASSPEATLLVTGGGMIVAAALLRVTCRVAGAGGNPHHPSFQPEGKADGPT